MATTAPSGAPIPQTDAERPLVEQLGEKDGIHPEFLEKLAKGLGETREAASVVMDSVDREPEKRVSFAEAVKLLKGKLDLEAARTDALKSHRRWGLVSALVKAGAIENAMQYGALFDEATVSKADLEKVRKMIDRGKEVLPIFDAGEMTPNELFAVLFTEGGVPHYTNGYGFKNLARLRRIDPKDIPDFANLAEEPYKKHLAAFKAAYKKAAPLKPTGASVTFTPDKREVTRSGTSATEDMQASAKGEIAFVGPNADMIRFRTQMDAGLRKIAGRRSDLDGMDNAAYRAFLAKAFADETIDEYMPDRERVTRYPDYAFEKGGVLGLGFLPNSHKVDLIYCHPDSANADFRGGRISLG